MKLDDLETVRKLAESRKLLLHKAAMLDAEAPASGMFLGYTFDADACDFLRRSLADRFRHLAGVAEEGLRELGVTFPVEAPPRLDPGPPHASIQPKSYDGSTGEFTVWISCQPVRSWRPGSAPGMPDFEVDEALNPHGVDLEHVHGISVVDATDPSSEWRECADVLWAKPTDGGVAFRVRVYPYNGLVRGEVAAGRIKEVGMGFVRLKEEIVLAPGDRLLANVFRWRLDQIRLHRGDSLAKAA